MDNTKRRIKISCLAALALFTLIAVIVLRGPHISNTLKKLVLPELEALTGKNIIVKNIYINIFPLFVEAKELKVFNETGERLVFAGRAKAYLQFSGLLRKQINIRRLVIKSTELTASKAQIEQIIGHIKDTVSKEGESALSVLVMSVEVRDGSIILDDESTESEVRVSGINGEIILGREQRIKASADKIVIAKEGLPVFTWSSDLVFTAKDKGLQIDKLNIMSSESEITASGAYEEGKGKFQMDIELFEKTVRDIFRLNHGGEGKIQARGIATYVDNEVAVDLKVKGNFNLETLMELLKVEDRIEGLVAIEGTVKGPLRKITGTGAATLSNGNLFGVDIDSLRCDISYADGTMRFSEGKGSLYNGTAEAAASITLPVVNFFTVEVDFAGIDSKALFKLIEWDPGFKAGKVNGNLMSSGKSFEPKGRFTFNSGEQGANALERVNKASGFYDLQGSKVALSALKISTDASEVTGNGIVDLKDEKLAFTGGLKTRDIKDITNPYYAGLSGAGHFDFELTGRFDDPALSGMIRLQNPVIEGYPAEKLDTDVLYSKKMLNVRRLTVTGGEESHALKGSINFRKARELFEFSEPEYNLSASLKNADFGNLIRIFYPEFDGTGRLASQLTISGESALPKVRGHAVLQTASVRNVAFDSASFEYMYAENKFNIMKMTAERGSSQLKGEAVIDTDGTFSYEADSDRIMLHDLVRKEMQSDVVFSMKSQGRGSFENPSVTVDARMIRGSLKGKPIGGGDISASLHDNAFTVDASIMEKKLRIRAKGKLDSDMPWNAKIDIESSRYDFLITSFLKEVPEDLILSLHGTVDLTGNRKHISGSSNIKHVVLSMYGYSFTNEEDIRLQLHDKKLVLNTIVMRSGNTSLNIRGSLELGKQYDLVFEGSSALSPFKSLSRKIEVLRGEADFVMSVNGSWDSPRVNGGLTLTNGSFGLKDYYHRLSALNGYLYIDEDRVVLQNLSGELGGGSVDISGILYLKKFSFKRFYVEADLSDITAAVSDDFSMKFGARLLYKGTPESQSVSGDIRIARARYRERVEWKSWLLKTKKVEKYKAEISNLEKAELNIKVTGKDNIFIDNNVARATMSADMVLRGTIYRPILFGRLESRQGTVYFRNNEFRILHASADFSDPHRIDPYMEINSETIVKGYKIKMNLEGQSDHFNLSLSSDPPLKEMDILALLTVGQTGGELKGLEGGVGASEATSFVTGKLQDVLEERLTSITGLDRLHIDPYVSKTTGTIEPRVTVSKRLLADKMFVTYTTSLATAEEQIIKIEYFLGKNISLLGIRDERGIVGGDVRFRFEFK